MSAIFSTLSSVPPVPMSACAQRAVAAGGTKLADPEGKNWGQTVAYLADPDSITIRVGSHIASV